MRILLVDDDRDDRELFYEAIEALPSPIICHTASDGRKALHQLNNGEIEMPDLIFLDINMPVMSGWKILGLLKEQKEYKNIPVVMYSTSTFSEDIEKARRLGAVCFFSKPNDFKNLQGCLESIITHFVNGSFVSYVPDSGELEEMSMIFF